MRVINFHLYNRAIINHCAVFGVDKRLGAGPRLIVGATDGKLMVGGTVGRPDNVDCAIVEGATPVIAGAPYVGVVWTVGVAWKYPPPVTRFWEATGAPGRLAVCVAAGGGILYVGGPCCW